MGKTAALHWLKAEDEGQFVSSERVSFIDGGSFHQGKNVSMVALARVGQTYRPNPAEFKIRLESSFLKKLAQKVKGLWHPADFYPATERSTGKWVGDQNWTTGSGDVTKEAHLYFVDSSRNRSGTLTVSQVEQVVSRPHVVREGSLPIKLAKGAVEFRPQMKVDRSGDIIHRIGASKDPDLRVVLMHPRGEGEADLLEYVRQLLAEATGSSPSDYSDGDILDLSDGFMTRDTPWIPAFDDGSNEIATAVDVGIEVEVSVPLPEPEVARDLNFSTAFGIRVIDISNKESYCISDVVEIEVRNGRIRVSA